MNAKKRERIAAEFNRLVGDIPRQLRNFRARQRRRAARQAKQAA